MFSDDLAASRILLTGATGFLGTAILERLLRTAPECQIVLLVRPGRRSTPDQRARREIFKNDCFDRLRDELGGADALDEVVARRVTVIGGDVSQDGLGLDEAARAIVATCTTVIHSAATVSFDAPLDAAVEVNLLGPSRIAALLAELGCAPHLVAVSTCYVAGNRRGAAPEQLLADSPFNVDVDWQAEVDGARRMRGDADAASRQPAQLASLRSDARAEIGAAGTPLLAAKTEQLRERWVADAMVEAGRARSASLGWPDAYAYTKALGEQALVANRGDVPVSIVRPAIIESALAEPRPGWIRGFRMAEPIIISYARGLLKEFPGVPEGIVDVIPVDLVVAAILAVAAKGPAPEPEVFQVASGSRNPLRYGRLVDLVNEYFSANPLYDADGQPIILPSWSFPGRGRVQAQLQRATTTLARAEQIIAALPLRGSQAAWAAGIEEKRALADRALGYVELYGAYAECEAIYGLDRLLALGDALDPADATMLCVDPAVIDWERYVLDVHLPSVVAAARVRTTPGTRRGPTRQERLRAQVLAPERHLVAFDLENTLIASNVVTSYAWIASRRLPLAARARFVAALVAEAPTLLALDRRDRSDFLRHFYRRYEGAPAAQIDEDVQHLYDEHLIARSFPAALRRVREHRRLGHRTVLITGALDRLVAPIAPLFDDVVCATLDVGDDGRLTGQMSTVPPTGETRAQALYDHCALHDLDPGQSVAYADSTSDLPLLEAVGFPVAVNPETRLATLARKRGWLIEQFERSPGAPRHLLPLAPRWTSTAGAR